MKYLLFYYSNLNYMLLYNIYINYKWENVNSVIYLILYNMVCSILFISY